MKHSSDKNPADSSELLILHTAHKCSRKRSCKHRMLTFPWFWPSYHSTSSQKLHSQGPPLVLFLTTPPKMLWTSVAGSQMLPWQHHLHMKRDHQQNTQHKTTSTFSPFQECHLLIYTTSSWCSNCLTMYLQCLQNWLGPMHLKECNKNIPTISQFGFVQRLCSPDRLISYRCLLQYSSHTVMLYSAVSELLMNGYSNWIILHTLYVYLSCIMC